MLDYIPPDILDGLIKAFKEVFEVEIFEDSLNEEEKNILEKIEEEK